MKRLFDGVTEGCTRISMSALDVCTRISMSRSIYRVLYIEYIYIIYIHIYILYIYNILIEDWYCFLHIMKRIVCPPI